MTVRITEYTDFARRAEAALEAAKAAGDPDWKIESIEEAIADAHEAIEDLRSLGL